eukprot:1298462-Pleurochrysis_carterae.AAC.1
MALALNMQAVQQAVCSLWSVGVDCHLANRFEALQSLARPGFFPQGDLNTPHSPRVSMPMGWASSLHLFSAQLKPLVFMFKVDVQDGSDVFRPRWA